MFIIMVISKPAKTVEYFIAYYTNTWEGTDYESTDVSGSVYDMDKCHTKTSVATPGLFWLQNN